MRTIIKFRLFGVGLLFACLILLSGCTWLPGPSLDVIAVPTEGHPNLEQGGLVVTFRCSTGTKLYELDPGDGGEILSELGSTFTYTYKKAGIYKARIHSGLRSKVITITVTNASPQIHPPFTGNCAYEWMEMVIYDARYREVGCGTGVEEYGVSDPDGDPIVAHYWEITGPSCTGETITYSVYDSQTRRNITGQVTEDPRMVIFLGWYWPEPPFPFFVNPMCGDGGGGSWGPPVCLAGAGIVTVTQTSWDIWDGKATRTFKYNLGATGCKSVPWLE